MTEKQRWMDGTLDPGQEPVLEMIREVATLNEGRVVISRDDALEQGDEFVVLGLTMRVVREVTTEEARRMKVPSDARWAPTPQAPFHFLCELIADSQPKGADCE